MIPIADYLATIECRAMECRSRAASPFAEWPDHRYVLLRDVDGREMTHVYCSPSCLVKEENRYLFDPVLPRPDAAQGTAA